MKESIEGAEDFVEKGLIDTAETKDAAVDPILSLPGMEKMREAYDIMGGGLQAADIENRKIVRKLKQDLATAQAKAKPLFILSIVLIVVGTLLEATASAW